MTPLLAAVWGLDLTRVVVGVPPLCRIGRLGALPAVAAQQAGQPGWQDGLVPVSRCELLRWQFELTWSLLEYHLVRLVPEDFLWEPADRCWTVRPGEDGVWVPDWAEPEPDPAPVPTIGWVSWHVGWWWTVAIDHARGRVPRERTDISWPGPAAAVGWLRELRAEWLAVLERLGDAELDGTARFPWRDDPSRTVAHMVGWVNAELMKNAAEVGQLRLLRGAGEGPAPGR